AEDGIRDGHVTGVQTCALPILNLVDINDALTETTVTPDELDQIYSKLNNLEVEIVDPAEVDRVKQPEAAEGEEEREKGRLDFLEIGRASCRKECRFRWWTCD